MRSFILLSLIGLFATLNLGCKNTPEISLNTSPNQALNAQSYFAYNNKTTTLVSAHRGGKNITNKPENSLESMSYLNKQGITIFEVDVNQTQDGVLVLMHDNSINRTTNQQGKLSFLDYEDLQSATLTDHLGNSTNYKIPTLIEALNWAKNNHCFLMLDIKQRVPYKKIIAEVRAYDMQNQVVLIAYSVNQATKLNRLAPEMMLSVPMRNLIEFKHMIGTGIPTERMIAFTGTRLSKPDLYNEIHKKNIMTILGTLGNLDNSALSRGDQLYKKYENLGIDIFATDRPIAVLNATK